MSFGIVRIQKMTSGSVRGIDIHDNRIKEFSHSNPDIDFSKSENNYKLKETENSFYNSVQNRIKELKLPKAVRKDAVVMSQALVTSDKPFFDGLPKEQQDEFFKKSYEFLENRYGKENIISATIHLDEKTPHMHVNFVPVTTDGRLCAKDVLNRKEMQSLQNDAYQDVFKSFGLERGETREDKRQHLDTEKFKIETQSKEIREIEAKKTLLEKKVDQLDTKVGALKQKHDGMSKLTEKLKKGVDIAKSNLENVRSEVDVYDKAIKTMDIPKYEVSFLGKYTDKVTFSSKDADDLIKIAESYHAKNAKLKATELNLTHTKNDLQTARNDLSEIMQKDTFKEIEQLKTQNRALSERSNNLDAMNGNLMEKNKDLKEKLDDVSFDFNTSKICLERSCKDIVGQFKDRDAGWKHVFENVLKMDKAPESKIDLFKQTFDFKDPFGKEALKMLDKLKNTLGLPTQAIQAIAKLASKVLDRDRTR